MRSLLVFTISEVWSPVRSGSLPWKCGLPFSLFPSGVSLISDTPLLPVYLISSTFHCQRAGCFGPSKNVYAHISAR